MSKHPHPCLASVVCSNLNEMFEDFCVTPIPHDVCDTCAQPMGRYRWLKRMQPKCSTHTIHWTSAREACRLTSPPMAVKPESSPFHFYPCEWTVLALSVCLCLWRVYSTFFKFIFHSMFTHNQIRPINWDQKKYCNCDTHFYWWHSLPSFLMPLFNILIHSSLNFWASPV